MSYYSRLTDNILTETHNRFPAVLVTGPRAVGKSTSAGRLAATVVNLDREQEAAAFRADPDAALFSLNEPVLLDEWQEVPEVLGAIKRAVDAKPQPGRFLLAGSVRADLDTTTWPGTGRVIRVRMEPMTLPERLGADLSAPRSIIDALFEKGAEPLAGWSTLRPGS